MESQELAKALGISGAYLSQLERGVRTNPSTELLDKIAMVLCLNKIETETLYDKFCAVVPLFRIIGSFPFAPKIGEIQRRKAFKIGRYLRSLS